MAKTSPTARTLKAFRDAGHLADVVERWKGIPGKFGVRVDLFGFIDVVAIRGETLVGVQATTGSNGASRVKKITNECPLQAAAWLRTGALIEVWGWRTVRATLKSGKPGKALRWRPHITAITLAPFSGAFMALVQDEVS